MLSKNLELTLHRALTLAKEFSHEFATLEHLLLSLIEDKEVILVLSGCGVDINRLTLKLNNFLSNDLIALETKNIKESKPTAAFQRVIHRAAVHVHTLRKKEITATHVLAEIFSEQDSYATLFLIEQNISKQDIYNFSADTVFKKILNSKKIDKEFSKKLSNSKPSPEDLHSASKLYEETALEKYTVNLNQLALNNKIDIIIGRENEVDRAIEVLCRRSKNNPILVGEPGVGKTAIAEGLAHRIITNNVPEALYGSQIFSLDLGCLVAGTRYRGDFEERIRNVISEINKIPKSILFIDEIHTIIGAGSTNGSSLDAGNLLKPALARGEIRCIGSTTFKEYQNHFEKDQALARRFQKIVVCEPSIEDACKMIKGIKHYFESHHKVKYTNEALEEAVKLSARYITDRHLPDKAIDIIDEAGAHKKIFTKQKNKIVTVEDIQLIISKITQIPAKNLSNNHTRMVMKLNSNLKAKIIGQDQAVEELVTAIKLSEAGLRRYDRPKGCYLFAGPTGVGKTELAKQLALLTSMNLIRIDMSEYKEPFSIAKLIGSPPGYVGFDQGGQLTDEVRKAPYSVVLLDEIEKAHPDIYNLMLQIMDYGKLTDSNGREINFTNTILIMTSNEGNFEIGKASLGFGNTVTTQNRSEPISKLFSPEFRNRLDAIIYFDKLNTQVVSKVVDKFIDQLKEQLADRNTTIDISKNAKNYLSKLGFSETNGARELERIISEKISKKIVDHILFGKLKKGGKVTIDCDNKTDELNFQFEAILKDNAAQINAIPS
jgi:ATP-dependent Clp protease ATP-binding subunit ClpA